jgi:hypothetical protein
MLFRRSTRSSFAVLVCSAVLVCIAVFQHTALQQLRVLRT